ncbi:hypothetical protein F3Y22_tig00116971pilonHSYRG00674 [Hibiscus syriacus]|uniref:DUF4283 domain-containing protein n=1 Tax=Hibiscus syriacus TaxID=106335 RepID=A0A6A2WSR5_HIBSY|nr:hypothetical protein F3Y22_tig00116971pilonHSYRG00674 [Hibiscus syriacus]
MGKVFSQKSVDGAALGRVFRAVWGRHKADDILELGDRFFKVKLCSDEVLEVILKRSSWTFDGDLFSLLPYDSMKGLDDYDFNMIAVWVRNYNLPLGYMSKSMGMALGGSIGTVIAVDMRPVDVGGDFLRVRVEINITKPLRRCVLLGSGKPRACPLKFERLPSFCYKFGIIGHSTSVCTVKVASKLPHGYWLCHDYLSVDQFAVLGCLSGLVYCIWVTVGLGVVKPRPMRKKYVAPSALTSSDGVLTLSQEHDSPAPEQISYGEERARSIVVLENNGSKRDADHCGRYGDIRAICESEIYFTGIGESEMQAIMEDTGIRSSCLPVCYLGISLVIRKLRISDCQPLVDKIEGRLQTWVARHLSYAGRIQLIQALIKRILMKDGPLWIAWSNEYDLKGVDFLQMVAKGSCSWLWKKLLKLRESLPAGMLSNLNLGTVKLWDMIRTRKEVVP